MEDEDTSGKLTSGPCVCQVGRLDAIVRRRERRGLQRKRGAALVRGVALTRQIIAQFESTKRRGKGKKPLRYRCRAKKGRIMVVKGESGRARMLRNASRGGSGLLDGCRGACRRRLASAFRHLDAIITSLTKRYRSRDGER